jgi:hypothetical protein
LRRRDLRVLYRTGHWAVGNQPAGAEQHLEPLDGFRDHRARDDRDDGAEDEYTVPATALFELAWRRQGSGGNSDGTSIPSPNGTLTWNLESSSGNPSVGSIGLALNIAASTFSQVVTQVLDLSRDYAEVGVLYPSTSTASPPQALKTFWANDGANQTAPNNGTTGGVFTGFRKNDATACTAIANPPGSSGKTKQMCQSWCYDSTVGDVGAADTLVIGLAARSTTVADELTGMTFGGYTLPSTPTSTCTSSICGGRMVHFPSTDGSIAAASGSVYSEQWYAYNPPYTSLDVGTTDVGATSYTWAIYGTSESATVTFGNGNDRLGAGGGGGSFNDQGKVVSVAGKFCINDSITANKPSGGLAISEGTNIKKFVSAGGTEYTAPSDCFTTATAAGGVLTISKVALANVSTATLPLLLLKPALLPSTPPTYPATVNLLNSAGAVASTHVITGFDSTVAPIGAYVLQTAPSSAISGYVVQGDGLSTTIRLPSTDTVPTTAATGVANTATYPIVQVHSGRGVIPTNTRVVSADSGAKTFTLSSAPTTPLIGAKVCGGVCGLFAQPGTTDSATVFSITRTGGTKQWAAGVMCLAGVSQPKIIPVSTSAVTRRKWWESTQ